MSLMWGIQSNTVYKTRYISLAKDAKTLDLLLFSRFAINCCKKNYPTKNCQNFLSKEPRKMNQNRSESSLILPLPCRSSPMLAEPTRSEGFPSPLCPPTQNCKFSTWSVLPTVHELNARVAFRCCGVYTLWGEREFCLPCGKYNSAQLLFPWWDLR